MIVEVTPLFNPEGTIVAGLAQVSSSSTSVTCPWVWGRATARKVDIGAQSTTTSCCPARERRPRGKHQS
eukprot:4646705-Prorocentrum_lima.AAC.1